jgi:hypothetical protein
MPFRGRAPGTSIHNRQLPSFVREYDQVAWYFAAAAVDDAQNQRVLWKAPGPYA